MTVAHLYPNINPSLLLDFANVKALDPRITFTRASNALYYDNSGVLRTAVNNQARFDHDPVSGESLGLLIEEQRTNLYLRSAIFDASWDTSTATINTANSVSPNGLIEAAQVVSDVGSNNGQIRQRTTKAANAITHTASVYAKTDGLETLSIQVEHFGNTSNRAFVKYSLLDGSEMTAAFTNGTFTNAASSIHAVANSWFRISLTFTTDTETTIQTRFISDKISGTGDGTSGVYLWGAQLEEGSFPTSYIRTEASQVTRLKDAASITGTNFSSWYRADEGSFYVEVNSVGSLTANPVAYSVSDGSFDNTSYVALSVGVNSRTQSIVRSAGSDSALMQPIAPYVNFVYIKVISAYQLNNFAVSADGATAIVDSLGPVPVGVDRMTLGSYYEPNFINGSIKKIAYYPQRLTNTQLQALSR